MIYFIHGDVSDASYTAVTKFENDITRIMKDYNAIEIQYGLNVGNKLNRFLCYLKCFVNVLVNIKSKDIIFFCLPFRGEYYHVFRFLCKIKGCKTYGIIIDIDSLRNSNLNLNDEISKMFFLDGLIVQNSAQRSIIEKYGYKNKIVEMGILDFLGLPQIRKKESPNEFSICYGGNLTIAQSGFIYEMDQNHMTKRKYYVYGVNKQNEFVSDNFVYKGFFDTEKVSGNLEGDFGLVWNGDCTDISKTEKGNYYRYASPHKLSMYLMAGMPVIVWDKSAMAEFVVKNNIGLSIQSLVELDEIVSNLKTEEYYAMLDNVQRVQNKIKNGEYLRNCISQVLCS